MIAVESKLFPGFPKSSIHCSSILAGVSHDTLVRLAKQSKWHWPLALVDAIVPTRLVSNSSAYWPIYGMNANYIDFKVGINPYEITPRQVIRIMPISYELQLVRRKYFDPCVPLVNAVMWIHSALKALTCTVFIARRWNFTHFPGTYVRFLSKAKAYGAMRFGKTAPTTRIIRRKRNVKSLGQFLLVFFTCCKDGFCCIWKHHSRWGTGWLADPWIEQGMHVLANVHVAYRHILIYSRYLVPGTSLIVFPVPGRAKGNLPWEVRSRRVNG